MEGQRRFAQAAGRIEHQISDDQAARAMVGQGNHNRKIKPPIPTYPGWLCRPSRVAGLLERRFHSVQLLVLQMPTCHIAIGRIFSMLPILRVIHYLHFVGHGAPRSCPPEKVTPISADEQSMLEIDECSARTSCRLEYAPWVSWSTSGVRGLRACPSTVGSESGFRSESGGYQEPAGSYD